MLSFAILITSLWWYGLDTLDKFSVPRTSLSLLICLFTVIIVLIFKPKLINIGKSVNKPIYHFQKIFIILFLIGLFGLLQFSKDIDNGTHYLFNATLLPFLIIWIMWVFINSDKELEQIIKLFYFTTTVFSIILLYNYFNNLFVDTSLINTSKSSRLGGDPSFPFLFHVQYDPVSLGVALSDIFPFFLTYALFKFKKRFSFFYIFPLLIIFAVIFLTGTRSAWIALAFSSLFVLYYSKIQGKAKLVFLLLVTFILVDNFYSFDINETLFDRILSLQSIQSEGNFLLRLELFSLGLEIAFNNVFGIGFGRLDRIIMNEHNFYTFIALGTGTIGLILYVIIIYLLYYYLKKSWNKNSGLRKNIAVGGIAVLIAFLINGFSDASIMETFQTNGVFISFGLALASYKLFLREQMRITESMVTTKIEI